MLHNLALAQITGIGVKTAKQLISYIGSAENVLLANKKKLVSVPGIGEQTADNILQNKELALKKAENILATATQKNTEILFYTHEKYPKRLKEFAESPLYLFHKGNTNLNTPRTVGIVGTRNASEYGKRITEKIIEELAPYNPLIVSGLAYGIDIVAHRAALKNNLSTVGIMGAGIDVIYPAAHKSTAEEMCANGGLLTEYSFGSQPDAPHFPERNRIIAGLSDALIVVETAEKGGTLITAEIAYSYNKEIYAVPGNLGVKTSTGSNLLIAKQKAQIFTSVDQIVNDLGWLFEKPSNYKQKDLSALSVKEIAIVTILEKYPEIQIDELSWRSEISISELASTLLSMEFAGHIKMLPGKKVKLV